MLMDINPTAHILLVFIVWVVFTVSCLLWLKEICAHGILNMTKNEPVSMLFIACAYTEKCNGTNGSICNFNVKGLYCSTRH